MCAGVYYVCVCTMHVCMCVYTMHVCVYYACACSWGDVGSLLFQHQVCSCDLGMGTQMKSNKSTDTMCREDFGLST